MSTPAEQTLCVFARAPVLGDVKGRLARDLGPQAALDAYIELVEHCLARCLDPNAWRCELWVGGDAEHPQIADWQRRYGLSCHVQRGLDLGERMHQALVRSLSPEQPRVLIGTDCPGIDRAYIRQAFQALIRHDVVIGPAEDGGYGLIGLNRPQPELFTGIEWGTASVLAATTDHARRTGLSVHFLDEIFDVDDIADWTRYRRLTRSDGPATE